MIGVPSHHLSEADRDALRTQLHLASFFFLLTACGYLYTISWDHPIPRDATTLVIGRDAVIFWMYGQAALTADPGRFYDPALFNAALTAVVGPGYPGQNWSYSPIFLILTAPFGQFSYLPALALWTGFGFTLFIAALRSSFDRRTLLLLVLSPAAIFCVISGQTSLMTAAALWTILMWLDRRPVAAGILIGLLAFKPQLAVLIPVMLIAAGRWKVFAAAAVSTAAVVALSVLLFGTKAWLAYIQVGLPTQNMVLLDPGLRAAPFMPTIFMNMRMLGAGYTAAMAVQIACLLAAAATVFWAFRVHRNADPLMLAALFLACTAFGSPYLLAYDTLALTVAAVALLAAGRLDAAGRRMVQLVYWLPLIQMIMGSWHVPGAALIPPAFAVWIVMQLRAEGARTSPGFATA
jgi:hypothetical protein